MSKAEKPPDEAQQGSRKNWLEWSVFLVSAVLVVGVVGYLAYSAATLGDSPPDVRVRLGAVVQQGDKFIIPVEATNHGDSMAESVQIEVRLETSDMVREEAALTIAFIPRRATREGWVTFDHDPRAGVKLSARAVGYEKP